MADETVLPVALSVKAKRTILKLDNGQVIAHAERLGVPSSDEVLILSVEDAVQKGRTGLPDLERLQALCRELNVPTDDKHGLDVAEADGVPPGKRPRTPLRIEVVNGVAAGPTTLSDPTSPTSMTPPAVPADWVNRAKQVVSVVQRELGEGAVWFNAPVDRKLVPDYYNIVKTPMDLGTILSRLRSKFYSSHLQFVQDMRQVWQNCLLYNGTTPPVGTLGLKGKEATEAALVQAGLSDVSRTKRTNAGVAREKFDPAEADLTLSRQNSKPRPARQAAEKAAIDRIETLAQDKSQPMSRERKQAVASGLAAIDGSEHLDGALAIMQEGAALQGAGADEEIELDIDMLEAETLWRLDEYLQNCLGDQYLASAAVADPVIVEQESDQDYSEADSDDDSVRS